jgi:hypothetical protein
MLSFKEAAGLCKTSYVFIWRLARRKGKLTSYKRLGVLRVDPGEVIAELRRNLVVSPGGEVPEDVLGPRIWITIKEAARELEAAYYQIYTHLDEFTRTRFFGKILILRSDIEKGINRRHDPSRALKDHETARQGLRL